MRLATQRSGIGLLLAGLAALAVLAGGCDFSTDWRKVAVPRSLDEDRMVYPSDPPAEGPFYALRGDGTVIEDLDRGSNSGTIQVKSARPVIPPPEPIEPTETIEGGAPKVEVITPGGRPDSQPK